MEWLSQNWIWIVAGIGLVYFMTRMHGIGHGMGMGCGSRSDRAPADTGANSGAAMDPVSRRMVNTSGSAISAVYRGRAYYFENRDDRDAFESDPEKYLAGAPSAGQPIEGELLRRRHGGC